MRSRRFCFESSPPGDRPMSLSRPSPVAPWLRAFVPVALVLSTLWFGPTAGRPEPRTGATCTDSTLQRWLAARLERSVPEPGWKDERAVFEALLATGQKSVDRYVVARALHRGDPGRRYGNDPVPPELDEAALLLTLREMPAFRNLQARIRAHPGRARVEVEVPGAVKPRVIAEEAAPETSNELLEAIRSAPTVTGPVRRREVDVVAELPSLVYLLGDDLVKSRVLVQIYRERPEVFAPIYARRKADPAFAASVERVLGASLTTLLQEHMAALVRDLQADLDRDGFPVARLKLLATDHPAAFDDIIVAHLRSQSKAVAPGDWRVDTIDGALEARAEAGHFLFHWRIPFRDLVLGDERRAAPVLPAPDTPAQVAQRCVAKLCLPSTD